MTEAIDVMSENTTGSGGVSLECNYIFEPSSAATGTKAATASNNADVGAVESIALRPVNIAPVLDATKSPALAAENQDAGAPIGAAGTLVSTLADLVGDVSGLDNVTDNDADGVAGIAITGADTVNGSWFYTSNSITWNSLPSVSDANALLLQCDAGNRLYFQPNTNFSGPISNAITFRAWDRTSGANVTLIPITTTGGNSAFSTASDTASITINAIAVAPLLLTPTLNSNHFQFTLTGTTGSLYVIDFSTNLSNTNWTSIQTSTAPILFTEPATNGHRFYRGKIAP
jgi:hypothetical protein